METSRFVYGFHRWHSPEESERQPDNEKLWEKFEEIQKGIKGASKRRLPPKNFYHSLEYLSFGRFDFFRDPAYLEIANQLSDVPSSRLYPISLALLDDEPWRRVGDLTNLQINTHESSADPYVTYSWWEQTPIPTWPYKYYNKRASC